MNPERLLFIAGVICMLSVTALSSSSRTGSKSRNSPVRSGGVTNRLLPDVTDVQSDPRCAPCGEIDFGDVDGLNECNPELLTAESFGDCLIICEDLASVNVKRSGSRSATVESSENCRCLCKSLKLAGICPEDSCNGPFQETQCPNNTENQTDQRCFERVFEDEETYNECVTSGNTGKQLPPSMLENPELDQTKGVERCNCVCDYVDKQSSEESPTEVADNTTTIDMNEPCSSHSDCMLKSRKVRNIRRRVADGNSFEDCASTCRHEFRLVREQTRMSASSRQSRSSKSSSVSTEDCDCYCSMFHDPCRQKTPTDTANTRDTGTKSHTSHEESSDTTGRSRSTRHEESSDTGIKTRTQTDVTKTKSRSTSHIPEKSSIPLEAARGTS